MFFRAMRFQTAILTSLILGLSAISLVLADICGWEGRCLDSWDVDMFMKLCEQTGAYFFDCTAYSSYYEL